MGNGPQAYLKAAEAYKALGDIEAARAILEKGYAATGDESLLPQEETSGGESLPPQEETAGDAVSISLIPSRSYVAFLVSPSGYFRLPSPGSLFP